METPAAPAAAAPAQPNGTQPATAKTETPAEVRYRLKVNGEEAEYARSEVEKFASKGAYADKAIRAAKERAAMLAKKEAELAEREKLWDDDEALEKELEKRGKLDKLARKRLEAKVEEQQKSPDQLRADKAEAEAKELRAEKERLAHEAKEAKQAVAAKFVASQMEKQLADAAERAGFEKSADAFYALYEVVKDFRAHGLPWDADRIVEIAQANIDDGFKRLESSVTKGLNGKRLVERLGPDVVKEVLRYKAEELRNRGRVPQGAGAVPPPQATPAPRAEHESPQDFMLRVRGLK